MAKESPRRGFGAFTDGKGAGRDREELRDGVLAAIDRVVTTVALSLSEPAREDVDSEAPFALYQELRGRYGGPGRGVDRVIRRRLDAPQLRPDLKTLKISLAAWQQRWNLKVDWCRDRVLEAME